MEIDNFLSPHEQLIFILPVFGFPELWTRHFQTSEKMLHING